MLPSAHPQLQAAGRASRAYARGVIERNPKIACAPAWDAAAASRLETEDPGSATAVPVPPPVAVLPNVNRAQASQRNRLFQEGNNERT
jgi:hypothetical protein